MPASERLKALDAEWRAEIDPTTREMFVALQVLARGMDVLPQILAVVQAAEAIQRNRIFLGDFPELDEAMTALDEALS